MPEIARFFGIIIRMFAEPGTQHHRPHFHAYYQMDWNRLQSGRAPFKIRAAPVRGKMNHPIYRVTGFKIVGDYTLKVKFSDDTSQVVDFRPVLEGELFGPLVDSSLFNQVRIDPEVHTLVWPNGADFDPATLHDWPDHEEEMHAMARRWAGMVAESR